MKLIRIFLLVLILIGIGLLVTQNLWVPRLIDMILKSETQTQQNKSISVSSISNKYENPSNLTDVPFKKGQTVGDFTVLSVRPEKYTKGYVVDFTGTTTVSGIFIKPGEDTGLCFEVSVKDAMKIPQDVSMSASSRRICFPADPVVMSVLPNINYGVEHTITISNYYLDAANNGSDNAAWLVRIVK